MTSPSGACLVAPVRDRNDPGDVDHYYCCDDDIALCGADLTGMEYMDRGPDWDCPLCVLVLDADEPCGVPGCKP